MPDAHLLHRSYRHLPGIGAMVEARLWAEGISDWADLIRHTPVQLDMYRKRGSTLPSALEASGEALANRGVAFFASRLPKREHYRIAASFPERCVFLDIESRGLSTYYDQVTLVGWSVDDTCTVLIDPGGIKELARDLREHPMIVTFNGSLFDLPFLARRFKKNWCGSGLPCSPRRHASGIAPTTDPSPSLRTDSSASSCAASALCDAVSHPSRIHVSAPVREIVPIRYYCVPWAWASCDLIGLRRLDHAVTASFRPYFPPSSWDSSDPEDDVSSGRRLRGARFPV